ncbi:hypothetical protein GBF38_009109 [Nibea albiflora]|uniref:Uncharacterized protein n=1 Tax=Nibea albiflora TaxID=240163 RepID=A0ACB7ER79_NIBAL|nr:hypothetical protein GBF38_009109 [Nibea albiflora]
MVDWQVVTSGRLTGRVKVQQPVRRRVTPNPGPAAGPEPAYSLYSTDSEGQVTSLHKGLDRCAALLSGILQAEKAEALPSLPKAVKGGAAKSRPSTSLGKKSIKKLPPQTDQKRCESGGTTPRTRRPAVPAAHSGVKLHPARKKPHTPLQSHPSPLQRLTTTTTTTTQLQTSTPPVQLTPDAGRSPLPQTDRDGEEDFVPVRDTAGDARARSPVHTCTRKVSDMQLEPGPVDRDAHSAEAGVQVRTVQYLLGELKALIAGQVPALQDELAGAQRRLQEVRGELAEARKALQDARSQLRDRETQNALTETDLEATRRRLLDSERERIELASLAQQRLEEIGRLNRTLQMSAADSSVSATAHRRSPAEPTADRISQYLLSLDQPERGDGGGGDQCEQNKRTSAQPRDALSQPADASTRRRDSPPGRSGCFGIAQLPRRDAASPWSLECSSASASTFDTRDEAAFRDGLSALDASIASLQKTLQLDLRS